MIVKTLYGLTNNTFSVCLYGTENKSKQIKLNKSKTHDEPFVTGNLDEFHLKIPEIQNLIGLSFERDEKVNGNFSGSFFKCVYFGK